MNYHGCSVKENKNGTSNGRERGFLPLYTTTTNKKGKKDAFLNKVNQGYKLPKRDPSQERRKKKEGVFMSLVQIANGFWEGL